MKDEIKNNSEQEKTNNTSINEEIDKSINKEIEVNPTIMLLGLTNWKKAASYNFKGFPDSFSWSEKEPKIFQPR